MKKITIFLSVLLILGHLSGEAWRLFYWIFDGKDIYFDPFLDPNYSFPEEPGRPDGTINLYWWVKYISDDFLWCITFFVMAKIAVMFSYRMFIVACVFFAYHVFDIANFLWNFKQYPWIYAAVYSAAILAIVGLFMPEKKRAIIKSLQ